MPPVSRDVLDTGDTLYLSSDTAPDVVRAVTVARVQHGLIWVGGSEPSAEHGERLVMECRPPDAAVYRAQAKVEIVPPEAWALRRVGEWERIQRRRHLRVAIWRRVDVELTHDADGTGIANFPMLDLSVGGVRLATKGVAARELTPEAAVRCHFALPDAGEFELPARIVRADPPAAPGKQGSAALCFADLDLDTEESLARWLQREQMRRGR